METKYISREAAINEVGANSWAGNRLARIPAADVVEVVRCKDCRHYTRKHGKLPWNTDKRYCNRSATVATAPDDFCSFGEKRAL